MDMLQLNSDPNRPRAGQHRDVSPSKVSRLKEATQSVMKAISFHNRVAAGHSFHIFD